MHTRGLHTLRRCLESALRARKSRGLHTPTRPWRVGARPAELRTPATPPTRTRHTSRARLRPSDCKGERARSALCRLILPPWIDGRGRRQRVPVRAAARVRGDSAGVRSPARAQARRARQALRLSRAPPLELLRRARKHRCVLRRLPARPSRARSPLRCRSALCSLSQSSRPRSREATRAGPRAATRAAAGRRALAAAARPCGHRNMVATGTPSNTPRAFANTTLSRASSRAQLAWPAQCLGARAGARTLARIQLVRHAFSARSTGPRIVGCAGHTPDSSSRPQPTRCAASPALFGSTCLD
jgi:hypothetical protein